jgi:hypothetical protein
MAHYRFYVFENNNGKLMGTGDFQSATDDTATECVKELVRGHDGEIWGQVARIDSSIKPLLTRERLHPAEPSRGVTVARITQTAPRLRP